MTWPLFLIIRLVLLLILFSFSWAVFASQTRYERRGKSPRRRPLAGKQNPLLTVIPWALSFFFGITVILELSFIIMKQTSPYATPDILLGHQPVGPLTTIGAIAPLIVGLGKLQHRIRHTPQKIHQQLQTLSSLTLDEKKAKLSELGMEIQESMSRMPPFLRGPFESVQESVDAAELELRKDFHLHRAKERLQAGETGEALRSLVEWKPHSLDALLVALESGALQECYNQLDQLENTSSFSPNALSIIQSEARQIVADKGWNRSNLREWAMKEMRSEMDTRRKAFLLYRNGEPERARMLLKNDPHACFWLDES